jgi:hypothetical protein
MPSIDSRSPSAGVGDHALAVDLGQQVHQHAVALLHHVEDPGALGLVAGLVGRRAGRRRR